MEQVAVGHAGYQSLFGRHGHQFTGVHLWIYYFQITTDFISPRVDGEFSGFQILQISQFQRFSQEFTVNSPVLAPM